MKTSEKVLIVVGILAVAGAAGMYFYPETVIGLLNNSGTSSTPKLLSSSTDAHVQTAAERAAMTPEQLANEAAMLASLVIPVRYIDPKLTT